MDAVQHEGPIGERPVNASIMCQLTRFGLSSPRQILPMIRDYRRVVPNMEDRESLGLLRSAFLIESPTSCCTFSVWSGEPLMSAYVPRHIDAVRRVFGRLSVDPERGPELWSTKWRLVSVTNNLNWGDFDLRGVIDEAR